MGRYSDQLWNAGYVGTAKVWMFRQNAGVECQETCQLVGQPGRWTVRKRTSIFGKTFSSPAYEPATITSSIIGLGVRTQAVTPGPLGGLIEESWSERASVMLVEGVLGLPPRSLIDPDADGPRRPFSGQWANHTGDGSADTLIAQAGGWSVVFEVISASPRP